MDCGIRADQNRFRVVGHKFFEIIRSGVAIAEDIVEFFIGILDHSARPLRRFPLRDGADAPAIEHGENFRRRLDGCDRKRFKVREKIPRNQGRREEEIRCLGRPSLRLSPHSFLVGRESPNAAAGFLRRWLVCF